MYGQRARSDQNRRYLRARESGSNIIEARLGSLGLVEIKKEMKMQT